MKLKNNVAVSDSGFLFNASRGESFSTNQTAKEILTLIKDGKSKEEIKEYFLNTYEVEVDQFEKDLTDFYFALDQYNLIQND
jgi:hypothetical protein